MRQAKKEIMLGANYYGKGLKLSDYVSSKQLDLLVLGDLYLDTKYNKHVKLMDFKETKEGLLLAVYMDNNNKIGSKYTADFLARFVLTTPIYSGQPETVKTKTVLERYDNVIKVDFQLKRVIK